MKRVSIIAIVFFLVIYGYLSIGLIRFFTRQICVKQLHMDNGFVQFVFRRDKTLLDEAAEYAGNLKIQPIDWETLYPFQSDTDNQGEEGHLESDTLGVLANYELKIAKLKSNISNYVEKYHPCQTYMKWFAGGYNLITMGREAALAMDNVYIAREEWLYSNGGEGWKNTDKYNYCQDDIDQLADNVADFYHFLDERDIGFIYASVGTKPCPYDDMLLTSASDNTNKARFLTALEERGVPYFDLSAMMPHDPQEWYKMYYCTDGHWNDYAGLWASGVLAQYLNDHFDFEFNIDLFSLDSFSEETRESYYRGGTGRSISPLLWGREPYTRLIPNFDTAFTITHYSALGVDNKKGNLIDAFFNNDIYDDMASWSEADYYDQTKGDFRYIENDDLYTIMNDNSADNKNKKILVLRDSYASYFAPYISADVAEVDLLYNPKFTGSIRTFIEETKPDAVIMLLVNSNIAPESAVDNIGSGYHFDLR